MSPRSKDLLGLCIFAVFVIAAIAGFAYAVMSGAMEIILAAIGAAVVIALVAFIFLYFVYGAYAVVKKRDEVHTEYSSSLSDIGEVDREMERGNGKH